MIDKNLFKKALGAEMVSKLKEALKFSTIEVKFEDVTLADGKVISVDKMEVGGTVTMLDENGVAMPAVDGEYETTEGKIIIVVGGLITEIKDKAVAEPLEASSNPLPAELTQLAEQVKTLQASFSAFVKENKAVKLELSETKKHLKVAVETIDKIVETPMANELEKFSSTPKKDYTQLSNYEKVLKNRGLI